MRTPSISGDVPQPSRLELLAGLLRFFTAPAEDQLRLLEEYTSLCEKDGGVPPHVDDPFVELAGGLWSCCRTCGTGPSFGITGPPEEVELLVRELASLVSLMLGSEES